MRYSFSNFNKLFKARIILTNLTNLAIFKPVELYKSYLELISLELTLTNKLVSSMEHENLVEKNYCDRRKQQTTKTTEYLGSPASSFKRK